MNTAININELPRHNGNFWAAAWEVWYGASEIATDRTEAAIAWYLDTFFSEKAEATYTTIGEAIGHLMVATVIVGMIARRRLQPWIDAQVEQALTPVSTEATEATDSPVSPLTPPVLKFGDSRFIGRPMSFPSASFFSVCPTDVLGKSIPGKAAPCETGSSSIERDSACVADVLILAQSKPS